MILTKDLLIVAICVEHGMMQRVNASYLFKCLNCRKIITDEMVREAIHQAPPPEDADDYVCISVS